MSKINNNNKIYLAWQTVSWKIIQQKVNRVQRRIYKASLKGDKKKVHFLQEILIRSFDAKLLAVREVTTLNRGKHTAGVDRIAIAKPLYKAQRCQPKFKDLRIKLKLERKALSLFKKVRVKFLSNKGKFNMAKHLELDNKAMPIRRVWIPKPGKLEKRPLGIPTIRDRAKQALAKIALEPEWEALFEPNSYGFRPGRRTHDAIEAIFLSLHHKTPKWIFEADIKKCFDRIDHKTLLSRLGTFPIMEAQINAWLKAKIMEGYMDASKEVSSSTMGTPQGGIISPLLANVALHGLELHLKKYVSLLPIKPSINSNRGKNSKMKALSVIRYADDFILTHVNKQIIDLCIIETEKWLSIVGLEISPEKSSLKLGNQGFNFLGFRITQVRNSSKGGEYKVKIEPNKEKIQNILTKIRSIIQNNKSASSYALIMLLRPIIIGWANYYKFCECSKTFARMTHLIFQMIRAWVFRRDTRNSRAFIKEKYFPSGKEYKFNGTLHKDNWILAGKTKTKKGLKEAFLPHMSWVHSEKFVKVIQNKSPFDGDHIYWALRIKNNHTLPTRVRNLLVSQKGVCTICKSKFTILDRLEVDHITPKSQGGKDTYANLQLLHRSCHVKKTSLEFPFSSSPTTY